MTSFSQVVVALIKKDDTFLVGKKKEKEGHPLSGKWHLPGGNIDECESDEQALRREVWEETGLEIDIKEFLGEDIRFQNNFQIRFYLCVPTSGNLKPGSDLTDVKFVSAEEIVQLVPAERVNSWPEGVRKYFIH